MFASMFLLFSTILESNIGIPGIGWGKVANFTLNTQWYLDPYSFTKKSMNPFSNVLVHVKADLTAGDSGLSVGITEVVFVVVDHATGQSLMQQTWCIEAMGTTKRSVVVSTKTGCCWHVGKTMTEQSNATFHVGGNTKDF